MKKFLLIAVAAFGMLMTACSKDEVAQPVVEESTVTFTISAPELATRAEHGDGTLAKNLTYAVYNRADGAKLFDGTATMNAELKATVEIPFVNGMTYDVLFWAESENSPYSVNWTAKTVGYANASALVSNSKDYDAFYAYVNDIPEITGPVTKTVELKRPFAQLNIKTNDAAKAAQSGVTVKDVKVVVKKGYTAFDFVTGNGINQGAVTFDTAAAQTTTDLLAVNYLFTGGEKSLVDVEFTYTDVNGKVAAAGEVMEFAAVPVQRNYRTNIVGSLLTSEGTFNVEIKPGFETVEFQINENGAVVVSSAEGLMAVAELINSGEGAIDIVLDGDIDLSALTRAATSNWTPIGTPEEPYSGTFDGKGFSIKNLNIVETEAKEGKAYIGFFGYAKDVTIKNIVFENVNLNIPCLDIDHSQGHIGAVAGSLEGTSTIENVTVKGDIKVYATQDANGASRVAVVAGGNSYGNVTMKNVHVIANEGSYLIANNNTGALAGQLQGKNVFENCSSNIGVTVNKFFAGGIIGLAAGDSKFVDCHTTGDVAVVAGRQGRAHDQYRVGGIAGGWADGAKNVCTLENCSYTGEISGKNSDGSVANPLDYMGYVGRGYTLNGCQGSTVVIDGIRFVQKYDTAAEAGIYDITDTDGNTVAVAASAQDLANAFDALNDDDDTNDPDQIILTGDIDLNDLLGTRAETINNGLTIAKNKKVTLDLGGFTLSFDSEQQGASMIVNNGDLTISNGNVAFLYKGQPDTNYGKGNYTISNSGKLTIDGATVSVDVVGYENQKFPHALYAVQTNGEVVINDGSKIVNDHNIALRIFANVSPAHLTINGGELKGLRAIWLQLPSNDTTKAPEVNVTINDGTLTGTAIDGTMDSGNVLALYSYSYGNQMKNVNITVNGGDFYGDIHLTGGRAGAKVDVEQLTINGGTFHNHNAEEVYNVCSWADDALAAETITIKGGEFSTLYPMVYLDSAEEVLTLAEDIALEETLKFNGEGTLDLNGKTLSGTCNAGQGHLIMVNNGATLNVKDSSANADGKITFAQGTSNTGWTIDLEGELNLYSGIIELTGSSWSIGYAVDVRPNAWGTAYKTPTTFNMYGGKLISSDGAIRVASSSSDTYSEVSANFNMMGGEIQAAYDGIFIQQSNVTYDNLNVNISGGKIKSEMYPVRLYGPVATGKVSTADVVEKINITGGEIVPCKAEGKTALLEDLIYIGGGATAETLYFTEINVEGEGLPTYKFDAKAL